jgi:transcriptional regulator with XRE-family HTH domain
MGSLQNHHSQLQATIAVNVKKRRLQLGLSQEGLAEVCGYHRTYIGSVERGERNITISTLEAIAAALAVAPADLLQFNG